jgi:DUF1680 family protein
LSLSGNLYCYRNPLASNGTDKLRNPWYDTTCCPPNLERMFESLPGYMYATSHDDIYVNLYHESTVNWHLEDGSPFSLSQSTAYPWNGDVKITVKPAKPAAFTLYLRWPAWAASADASVNGQPVTTGKRGSFIAINRTWNAGDTVSLSFPMTATNMVANPRVADDYGRVAIQRGPLVYALEQTDQPGVPIGDIFTRASSVATPEVHRDMLGGITVLKVSGFAAEKPLADEPLYQAASVASARAKRGVTLTFIPYFTVGNRENAAMEVWVPLTRSDNVESNAVALGGVLSPDKHPESVHKTPLHLQ